MVLGNWKIPMKRGSKIVEGRREKRKDNKGKLIGP
jgi:hypothetical protein